MEEQKYFKRKQKALNGTNKKILADICFEFGLFYKSKNKFKDALKQLEESKNIYFEIDAKSECGNANRMIGETWINLGHFQNALKYVNVYLSISRELKNVIEEQRALTTLGRVYLHQEENEEDINLSKISLNSALKMFQKSLSLCESCKGKVNNHELMDMRARSLFNIGVTCDRLGNLEKALDSLQQSINICKNYDLYELLTDCHIVEGLTYLNKKHDYQKAINCFNVALENASRLENKIARKCEILCLKADALCVISDFQSAKMILLKAWKMNNPNQEEAIQLERKIKTVAALCYTEDLLVTTNSDDYAALKSLYEKMGDGACILKNYNTAIYYYLKMLDNAEKSGDSEKELIPAYISLYQTYKDLKDYDKALEYGRKEFNLVKENYKEAVISLINIANLLELAGKNYEIEDTLSKARKIAQENNNIKLEKKCLKILIKYYSKIEANEKVMQLEKELLDKKDVDSSDEDLLEEDCNNSPPDIGEDICLDDLTDFSDNEDSEEISKTRTVRKRGKGFTIKKNSKGETQLHQACISGNILLVTRLVSQGHPINVRDNAGWLPIHEACIHGHKLVAEFLINNGAHVNDRGGTQCDGITPLYDAASNGHLEVVELMLSNGASAIIKTDFGDSALDALKKWHKTANLASSENILFQTIYSKMHKASENTGCGSSSVTESCKNNSLTPLKRKGIDISNESCNTKKTSLRRNIDEADDVKPSRNKFSHYSNSINTDSDSSNSSEVKSSRRSSMEEYNKLGKEKDIAINQYKNAISNIRNRCNNDIPTALIDADKPKRGALLSPGEVGDDWLENDIIQTSKRRKRLNSDSYSPVKEQSNEKISPRKSDSIGSYVNNIDISESPSKNINDNSNDSFEDFQISPSKNILSSNVLSNKLQFMNDSTQKKSSSFSLKKWKRQTSLTKIGFSLNKTNRKSNKLTCHISDIENWRGEEPDSTTEIISSTFPSNKINNQFNMKDTARVPEIFSNMKPSITVPPITVKVKVQEKLLLVPLPMDIIESLTIDWLAKETSRRYYNIEGVQPLLQLNTSDGAILVNEDPLSIVLNSNDLKANIISWNLPSLVDRYAECCAQFNNVVDKYIKMQLETSQATHILQLSNISLTKNNIKSVFKTLNHQSNLKSLLLSNNSMDKDNVKLLAQALPTMSNISYLNLSGNFIDSDAMQYLILMFENSNTIISEYLDQLDLSFNPLNDLGFVYVIKLTKFLNLKYLNLRSCDIVCENNNIIADMNLSSVEVLDISYNYFTKNAVQDIFKRLRGEKLSIIKLDGLNLTGGLSQLLHMEYSNLKEINLSRCSLSDIDVADLLRSFYNCSNVRRLLLCYNTELSFISFRRLVQSNSLTHLNLEGCFKIFHHMQQLDPSNDLFTENEVKLEEIIITYEKSSQRDVQDIINKLSVLWQNYWSHKCSIDESFYGRIVFRKK